METREVLFITSEVTLWGKNVNVELTFTMNLWKWNYSNDIETNTRKERVKEGRKKRKKGGRGGREGGREEGAREQPITN